ncbi:MAG: hypothetical protein HFE90_04960 [Firmicutes bacterium]|nr:hypothetical protein [Bacillota bacterium]
MTRKINFFSEKNIKSQYLSSDLKRCDNSKNIYVDILESVIEDIEPGAYVSFFLIKEDEKENLKDFLKLIELCREITDTEIKIYVFSSSDVARMVLDSVNANGAEVILIDPVELAAWSLMEKRPLYYAKDRLHDEEIKVTIIGRGPSIPILIKTVSWCGRMRHCRMKLNMIGNDMAKVETELKLRNPGLFTQTMEENLDMRERGLIVPELYLPLRLTRSHYYQADTSTEEFEIALNKCLDSNYIIIDESDDEETLRTAMTVRAHFIRKHILHENYLTSGNVDVVKLPDICVYIRDANISAAVPELTVEGRKPDSGMDELAFIPFGSHKEIYSSSNIVAPDFKKLAHELFSEEFEPSNNGYYGDKLSISDKRSLYASALHLKYKLRDMDLIIKGENSSIYNSDNFVDMHDVSEFYIRDVENDLKFVMAALEHQCWCVFKLCDGWIPADAYHALGYGKLSESGGRDHRHFAGKMSAACVESSALSGTGTKLYGNPSYFTNYNREIVMKTYDILKKVYPNIQIAKLSKQQDE